MSIVPTVMRGTVHGRIIKLEAESGMPEGLQVTVTLEPADQEAMTGMSPLEALKRAAGSWSDDPEGLDQFLEWNRRQRKINRRELPA
jgi:hypothetical protein